MQSELLRLSDWEWVDVGCTAGNFFICQRPPEWSIQHLQQAVLKVRREMDDSFTDITTNFNTQIKYLLENPSKLVQSNFQCNAY